MAFGKDAYHFYILFFLYGLYAAATEGISKAWISNISSKEDAATSIGTYAAFQSICTMVASALAGFIWFSFGDSALFLFSGIVAFFVAVYIMFMGTMTKVT